MKSENLQWCCQSKSSRVVLDSVKKFWALDFADWRLLKDETTADQDEEVTASQKLQQMGFCIDTVQRASAKCSRFSCLSIVYYCYWIHLAFPVWALPLTSNQMYMCAGSIDVNDILECLLNGNDHNVTSSENEVKRFIKLLLLELFLFLIELLFVHVRLQLIISLLFWSYVDCLHSFSVFWWGLFNVFLGRWILMMRTLFCTLMMILEWMKATYKTGNM